MGAQIDHIGGDQIHQSQIGLSQDEEYIIESAISAVLGKETTGAQNAITAILSLNGHQIRLNERNNASQKLEHESLPQIASETLSDIDIGQKLIEEGISKKRINHILDKIPYKE